MAFRWGTESLHITDSVFAPRRMWVMGEMMEIRIPTVYRVGDIAPRSIAKDGCGRNPILADH